MAARFTCLSLVGALTLVAALGACNANPPNLLICDSEIVSGAAASSYTEAVFVDMLKNGSVVSACSGALIAPQVVLTAGHCVDGFDGWHVTAPYAGDQTAVATSAETFDWKNEPTDVVNPSHHDIGLVYLSKPIVLTQYPVLAQIPLPSGSRAVNVGRIQHGKFSSDDLFVGQATVLTDATSSGQLIAL